MRGLKLCKEYQEKRRKSTAIAFCDKQNTRTTQISASEFPESTGSSHDVLKAFENIERVGG